MKTLTDVFKELVKMFVADMRLTLMIMAGVAVVWMLLAFTSLSGATAGLLLVALCLAVLLEAVMRETARRRGRR